MTNDVAIIGVGLHPFGRFDKTAMWLPVGPLVGTREVTQPCDRAGDSAQQPLAGNDLQLMRNQGVPLRCAFVNNALRWVNF